MRPDTQTVEVCVPDEDVPTLGMADTLTAGAVFAGFSLPVADIFR